MQKLLGLTWIEVNLDAIAQNVKNIKELIGEKKELMAVVKGNAYGHDILEISSVALNNGATRLAVARLEEAIIPPQSWYYCSNFSPWFNFKTTSRIFGIL